MASNELYAQLEACRLEAGGLFECWVDGVSIQVQNRGGFFCRVALPGRIGMQNEQLAPLLRLAEASLMGDDPIALAYDSRQQRACLVRWLNADADTSTLIATVENLANQQAAWIQVLAEQAPRQPASRPAIQASLGLGLLHRGLMNG
ncbi:hypothetical protein SAMN05216596_102104 [Pseudomonas congelans]|jgi:hypothetical protein|uniref:HrpG n=2 Tax=Pseudomonas TaxID=286 RepID=C8BNV6_PSESY|nr:MULTISPECIES: hypothetical protein [Pseudomonas]ACU65048.1 HrpG [Pseudomonas syringae pv. syringae]KFE48518.1 hypothetical protein IV03_03990 [Pseudomonas congelans]KPW82104.1 HrpG [Pseudomonas congelans]MBC8800304.1 hypothetical protein [Pseudomonas congelans]MBP1144330.1 hypothetical protein [Pseudomonas sp. PvP027]